MPARPALRMPSTLNALHFESPPPRTRPAIRIRLPTSNTRATLGTHARVEHTPHSNACHFQYPRAHIERRHTPFPPASNECTPEPPTPHACPPTSNARARAARPQSRRRFAAPAPSLPPVCFPCPACFCASHPRPPNSSPWPMAIRCRLTLNPPLCTMDPACVPFFLPHSPFLPPPPDVLFSLGWILGDAHVWRRRCSHTLGDFPIPPEYRPTTLVDTERRTSRVDTRLPAAMALTPSTGSAFSSVSTSQFRRASDSPFFLLFPPGSAESIESTTSPDVPPPALRPRHPKILPAPESLARAATLPASPTSPVFSCIPQPRAATGVDATPSTSRTCAASLLAAAATPLLRHRINATLGVVRATRRLLPTASRCVRICAAHPSAALPRAAPPYALHAHGVPHAALLHYLSLAAIIHAPCAPRRSRQSHPRAAHLCTPRTIRAVARPAPRRPVPEIAFVQHCHARPQIVHRRPLSSWNLIVPPRTASYTVFVFQSLRYTCTYILFYVSIARFSLRTN
ncbi:hypothetical protein K438DRAFT_2008743 [Mycena galopus ATCC 62051]|nr:hypothetical protein K438DRAFT_2008743 [Mycena galopus ATCC 62051]